MTAASRATMPGLVRALLVSTVLVVGLEHAAAAACAVDTCTALATPLDGRTLPANVATFPTRVPYTGETSLSFAQLLRGDEMIAVDRGSMTDERGAVWVFLRAKSPLAPGDYRLEERSSCGLNTPRDVRFTVGAQPLTQPSKAGRLFETQTFLKAGRPSTANCPETFAVDTIEVAIEIEIDPGLEPLLPALQVSYALAGPGGEWIGGYKAYGEVAAGRQTLVAARVSCGASVTGLRAPGQYYAMANASGDGLDPQLREELRFRVTCPADPTPTTSPPPPAQPSYDGTDGHGTVDYHGFDDSGCQLARGRGASAGWALALTLALALARRRRSP